MNDLLHLIFLAARLLGAALILLGAVTSPWLSWLDRPAWWAMAAVTSALWAADSAANGLTGWFLWQIASFAAAAFISYRLADDRARARRRRVSHRG